MNDLPSTEELRNNPLLFIQTFFIDEIYNAMSVPSYMMGVDWAKDSGMNRGDIISRNDNVIKVRFKTVTINN